MKIKFSSFSSCVFNKIGVSEKYQRSFPRQIEIVELHIDQIPGANSVAVIYGCELAVHTSETYRRGTHLRQPARILLRSSLAAQQKRVLRTMQLCSEQNSAVHLSRLPLRNKQKPGVQWAMSSCAMNRFQLYSEQN